MKISIADDDPRIPFLRAAVEAKCDGTCYQVFAGTLRIGQILKMGEDHVWQAVGKFGAKKLSTAYTLPPEKKEVGINFIIKGQLEEYERFLATVKSAEAALGKQAGEPRLVGSVWAVKIPGIEAVKLDMRVKLPEGTVIGE